MKSFNINFVSGAIDNSLGILDEIDIQKACLKEINPEKYERILFDIFYSLLSHIENHDNTEWIITLINFVVPFRNMFDILSDYCEKIDEKYNIREN